MAVVRYAVVGLGHIAQAAILPAFAHAKRNSKLVAVVSGDRAKRREIARKYRLEAAYDYDEYEACLANVDAVYIALPNSQHAEYTIRAANAGVHVLCEKPLAVTADECEQMIEACAEARVKLMCAYRLHFEEINLRAMRLLAPGGFLITCSCSYNVSEEMFAEVIHAASADSHTPVTMVEKRMQGRDHPVLVGVPETYYLKCFILRRVE